MSGVALSASSEPIPRTKIVGSSAPGCPDDWMAENPDMLPAKAFARFVPAAFTSSSDSTDVTDPVRATFF